MKASKNPYQKHIFICTNHRKNGEVSCAQAGEEICEYLKSYVKDHGLKGKVRVSRSGCFDLCAQGPNVMIFPDNIWYRHVEMKDLKEVIESQFDPLLKDKSSSNKSTQMQASFYI